MAYRRSYRRFTRGRRPAPRRRFKRRYGGARRVRSTVTQTDGTSSFVTGFRGKRIPYRKWLNSQVRSGDGSNHFRSARSVGVTENTGAGGSSIFYRFQINGNFWQTAGGLINTDVTNPNFTSGDLMIRGGMSELICTNTSSTNHVSWTSWCARTTMHTATLTTQAVDPAFDPSCLSDFQKSLRFWSPVVTTLAPLESCTRSWRIPPQKIDQDLYTQGSMRNLWIFKFSNLSALSATACNVESRHNLSFTGDMTAP